ncbi:ferrous iron transport protein A [bacterium]|nr:ferrous iron transport protein A [bacterium]
MLNFSWANAKPDSMFKKPGPRPFVPPEIDCPNSCKKGQGRRHQHGRHYPDNLRGDEKFLSDCQAGDSVCVKRILNGGPIRHRLLEMGLNPGTQIRVVKYAPLKDPIECQLKGYHIALRVAEASHVIVTPEKPST